MPYSLSITSFIFPPAIIRSTCSQSLIGTPYISVTLHIMYEVQIAHNNTDQRHHMGYTMQWQDHSALADRHLQGCHGIPTPYSYRVQSATKCFVLSCSPATCIIQHVLRCRNTFFRINPLWRLIHTQLKG